MSNCEVVIFPFGIMGQVWCLIVSIPGLEVIKPEFILRLKIKHNDWLRVRKQRIIVLYFESEIVLRFNNIEA